MQTIYNFKADQPVDVHAFEQIIAKLIEDENCDCVILGCTELSCIEISERWKPYCVDAMQVLVNESIIRSGKELKKRAVVSNLPI